MVYIGNEVGTGGNGAETRRLPLVQPFPPRWERLATGGSARPMERAIYSCPRGHEQARGGLCERCGQDGRRRVWTTLTGWRP